MNKKIWIGILSAGVALGGALSVSAMSKDHSDVTNPSMNNEEITMNKAKEIALNKVQGHLDSIERKQRGNQEYYEVEIEKNHVDYEVYINASSGAIEAVHKDDDDQDDFDDATISSQNTSISEKEAISIAEKEVNGTVTKIEKDEDDGIVKYEIELRTKNGEVDIDIDASTGKIVEMDYDND